jgi:hypothetical protein
MSKTSGKFKLAETKVSEPENEKSKKEERLKRLQQLRLRQVMFLI